MESLRADHLGSLLRPPALLKARNAFAAGRLSKAALRVVEDDAIVVSLARQREVGLPVLSDGEFRRASWITEMAASVHGFVEHSRIVNWHGIGGGPEESTSKGVGEQLVPWKRIAADEASYLAAHSAGERWKVALPAPSNFYLMGWKVGITDAVYADRAAMMADVVAILRAEIESLIAEGVPYIQLDAPYYGAFLDVGEGGWLRGGAREAGISLAEAVGFDNASIAGLRGGRSTIGLHVCRGNSRGRWFAEGGYDPLAEQLFGSLEVDRFLLEYDSELAGSFEPLRYVPPDKIAVLGLITTKTTQLESSEAIARRIAEAAQYLPLEQLALSPQCGFASVAEGNPLSEEDQWHKLQLVVGVANAVWG
jgi:5-methyltetrahydropteroyltriglutamate--homocysteine methyltransferase